ncbi:alpha,alpha-trehalose-phosphate synthase (UDP-forming) [Methyloceanibacter sp.]|uniref:alpha,alpha-trehalose-phosphate synthase (UDP-forming) n=1 Tax=Methyloceanibacter sp. TaxID=1965321 RepID=UPI003C718EE6
MRFSLSHPLIKYAATGVAAILLIIITVTPLMTTIVEGWSRRDVELRSRLVFRSIEDRVTNAISVAGSSELTSYFEHLAEDEKLIALGFCDESGKLTNATKLLPKTLKCEDLPQGAGESFSTLRTDSGRYLVSVFPITAGEKKGHVVLLHDLNFVDDRAREARLYLTLALIGVAVGLSLLATAVVLGLLRGWRRSIKAQIEDFGLPSAVPRGDDSGFDREIQSLLSELNVERRYAEGIKVEWSPATLRTLLEEELPSTQVLVVSNREPYIHNRKNGEIELQIPASGLVAAVEPVMRACGGTWIAHGSGSADKETVDASDRLAVPPADPAYMLRRVWLSEEEQEGYYYGFANEGLWPLCHIAFIRPIFRESDWKHYAAVNERFADAVVKEATQDDPIVLVQDYHFALLPRMVRQRLPKATIVTFWHIPWPNSETFSICPWREEIIDGLLGSTILGFHTQFHCNNFLEATDRFMESRIDRERASVTTSGMETLIRAYPISIEWPPAALASQAPVEQCRQAVRERFSLPPDAVLLVGIERFDYTKGILDRLRAVDDLLAREPSWKGRLVFIQAAAPTRNRLERYSELQEEGLRLAVEINERHGTGDYRPVELVVRHHSPDEVYELFRAADACIVSSLHDGMNLVAKEFVAARDDEQGVLILSSFAGASRELSEALIVNPYDTSAMASTLERALLMPKQEQRDRMRLMRELIRERNVYRWAAQMLMDASRLRKRERIRAKRKERALVAPWLEPIRRRA